MTSALTRRLNALEDRAVVAGDRGLKVFFATRMLDRAARDAWEAETVAPARAAGAHVLVVRFVAVSGGASALH